MAARPDADVAAWIDGHCHPAHRLARRRRPAAAADRFVLFGDRAWLLPAQPDDGTLRFGVRNGLGAEIYNWTAMPSRTKAEPGERLSFRSRLASPPLEMHDISVRFYNPRDARAGLR